MDSLTAFVRLRPCELELICEAQVRKRSSGGRISSGSLPQMDAASARKERRDAESNAPGWPSI